MKIKLNGWQRIVIVSNAIYLIIIIIIAWNAWPTQKQIESLGIDRLKIVGIFFMWWIIPSGIVYLLGFSIGWIDREFKENKTSTKIPSKQKRILTIIKMGFKNIRVGIILILVGIFIPTVLYPLTVPSIAHFGVFDYY